MNLTPNLQQPGAMFGHQPQCFADLAACHRRYFDKLGPAIATDENDLGLAATIDVDVGRVVVVLVDGDLQTLRAQPRDHAVI
jgi:hypothetical protein